MIGICDHCGKPYETKPSAYKRYKHHYCTKECFNDLMRETFLENFENAQRGEYSLVEYFNKKEVKIRCSKCGEETVVESTRVTQYIIPCKKCKEIREAKKRAEEEKLQEIRQNQQVVSSLFDRLQKAHKSIIAKEKRRIARRQSEKLHELIRENRIKNNGEIDKDITLEKLYARDGKKCYLCGRECNYADHKVVNGHFIAGSSYPSIDHVKPLSKGGSHTWENVKLACMSCNSRKGAKE